jgi:uncharacterized protein (TIGR02145 family)
MWTTTARDATSDQGAVHRRAEKVADEVQKLQKTGDTVEVDGAVRGEIKASLANRGITFTESPVGTPSGAYASGARTALDGLVVVKRKTEVVGRVRAAVVVVPVRELSYEPAPMSAVELGVTVLWADTNLDVRSFNDGTRIREASAVSWRERENNIKKPLWCHYDDDKANGAKWGKMYYMPNIEALGRLCPAGWRIPTKEEWHELLEAHGVVLASDGDIVADKDKARAAWKLLQDGPFRGVLGGHRTSSSDYKEAGYRSFWPFAQATDVFPDGFSFGYSFVNFFEAEFNSTGGGTGPPKTSGYYVRCVRDKATVRIGTQVWTAHNSVMGKSEDEAQVDLEWKGSFDAKAAWCYYDNDPAANAKFGRIYGPRGLHELYPHWSPWRVPQWEDWAELLRSCGVTDADITNKTVTGEAATRALAALQSGPFGAVLGGARTSDGAFHGATSEFSFAALGDFDASRGAYKVHSVGYSVANGTPTITCHNSVSGVSVRMIDAGRVSGLRCARVGTQVWTKENWDGGAIQRAHDTDEWERLMDAGTPAWCYYGMQDSGEKMYNKHVLPKARLPDGWRAPTLDDMMTLIRFYNVAQGELTNTQRDEKSLAVWTILRDGPFRAIACGLLEYIKGGHSPPDPAEYMFLDRNATWMVDTTSVSFSVDDTSVSFRVGQSRVSGGSIRLIRKSGV